MRSVSTDVGAEQVRLIDSARAFVHERARRGYDVALDPECYLTAWSRNRGNARLRRLAYGWSAESARVLARARDAVALLRSSAFVRSRSAQAPDRFDHLIVSWALPSDFDTHGGYTDRYLRVTSASTPSALWLLILLDGSVPENLAANVHVLAPTRGLRGRVSSSAGVVGKTRRLSRVVAQAHSLASVVSEALSKGRFRQVVMPYEGQPFQHAINLAAKACDPAIRTLGYLHSALPALPTDFVCRAGAPDRLLVNGIGQAEILSRLLGWAPERLGTIPSLRFLRDGSSHFAGRILLPYAFSQPDVIAIAIETLMREAPVASMPRWEVRNHPVMAKSPNHIAMTRRLQAILQRYADRMSPSESVRRQTVIIGATAAVLEALERGMDVLHVCPEPLFQTHSARIWTRLETEALRHDLYRYRLRERGCYIDLGESAGGAHKFLGLDG